MTEAKLSKVQALLAAGDEVGALRAAARCVYLGEHRDRIRRGWTALQRPEFYREIGCDPAALVRDGVLAVRERFGPSPDAPPPLRHDRL